MREEDQEEEENAPCDAVNTRKQIFETSKIMKVDFRISESLVKIHGTFNSIYGRKLKIYGRIVKCTPKIKL